MRLRNLFMILLLCMTVGLFAVSCSDGDTGPQGPPGETGPPGPAGTPAPTPDPEDEDMSKEMEDAEDCTIQAGPSSPVSPIREFGGTTTDDVICGTDEADYIKGGEGNDTIFGLKGNDKLEGGLHGDNLHGGEGNDTLIGNEGDDTLDGGAGSDTADYSDVTTTATGLTITVSDGDGLTINLADGKVTNDGYGDVDTFISIENITGSDGGDTITGDDKDNVLKGGAGDDTIRGGAGDDTINGGGQTGDRLHGGADNDTLEVTATQTLNSIGGIDETVTLGDPNPNSSGFENLTDVSDVNSTVTLTGNGGDNVLDGGIGTNTLTGDSAAAVTAETTGKDTFVIWVRHGGDTVIDTISDFQFPDQGSSDLIDKIVVKRMANIEGESTAEAVTETAGLIIIRTGALVQRVQLTGRSVANAKLLTGQGDNDSGKGSKYLMFEK